MARAIRAGFKANKSPRGARSLPSLMFGTPSLRTVRIRKAWSVEKAVEYIATESGNHFDPEIAQAFLEMFRLG